jgi:hypothetical protein
MKPSPLPEEKQDDELPTRLQNLSFMYEQALWEISTWRRRAVIAEEERARLRDKLELLIEQIERGDPARVEQAIIQARLTLGGLSSRGGRI